MNILVCDTETNGLAYECDKLHVFSWTWDGEVYDSTNDYEYAKEVIDKADLLVMHNGVQHDLVVFNRILELTLDYTKFIDTLALSWYLYPDRKKHGLAEWGEDLGIPKPKVNDWENLSYEEYAHRCQEDVKINWLLWQRMRKRLEEIYE